MFKPSLISLAVLTAALPAGQSVAVLSAQLIPGDEWQQLLPDGEFSSKDGRPKDVPSGKWVMNERIAARLKAAAEQRKNDIVIDYEHQTLNAEKNGKEAPASGWFKELDYRPGSGLFFKPGWTRKAQAHIDEKEYRYVSAVFLYDKATGEPTALHSVALTNDPGIDGMNALAALTAHYPSTTNQREKAMNELLKKLLAKLGIVVPDGTDPTEQNVNDALAALTTVTTDKDKEVATLTAEIAALKADTGNIDYTKYVPVAAYSAIHQELAQLKASHDVLTVDQVIKQAEEDGKLITEGEKSYLQSLGKQNMAALKDTLNARPVLAALKGKQTHGVAPEGADKKGVAALTADQKSIADQMGISHEELAKDLGV